MIHTWSVLCKKASVDSVTNVISLFDVIEKLTITKNPEATPLGEFPPDLIVALDFEVVTLISDIGKKERKPFIRIELFNAQNEKMGGLEQQLEVTPLEATSLRSRVSFDAIKIKGEGNYTFKISLKTNKKEIYKEVAKIPLEVKIIRPAVK